MPVIFGSGGSGGGSSPITANRAAVSDGLGAITASATTDTQIGYLSTLTGNVQTALDAKAVGPGSATDEAIARYDGTTGKLFQNSGVTITDANVVIIPLNTTNTANLVQWGTNAANFTANGTSGATIRTERIPTNGQYQFEENTTGYFYFAPGSGFAQAGKYDGTHVWDNLKSCGKNTAINGYTNTDAYYSNTAVGNVGAGEDDLISKTIHARTLATTGDCLEIWVDGFCAANANNKTIKVYFAGSLLHTLGPAAFNGLAWWMHIKISMTGSNAVKYRVASIIDTATTVVRGTLTPTLTSNQTFKLTGEATADNDIVQDEVRILHRPPTS